MLHAEPGVLLLLVELGVLLLLLRADPGVLELRVLTLLSAVLGVRGRSPAGGVLSCLESLLVLRSVLGVRGPTGGVLNGLESSLVLSLVLNDMMGVLTGVLGPMTGVLGVL